MGYAMNVTHDRRQHSVGQGFFHSGNLYDTDGKCRLRYVIDCGSKAKYQSNREKQIDDFVSGVGAGGMLDLLLISHIHEDHVSGIERLLDRATGLKVDTIMMPLTTVEERLIAFARSVEEDDLAANNAFYQQFVTDPEAALSKLGPRQIILVRPGAPDDGAPGGTGEPLLRLPDDERPRGREDIEARREWRLVGKGQIERRNDLSTQSRSAVQVSVLPDSAGIAAPGEDGYWEWLIAPYVDPKVNAGIGKFERKLARCLKIKVAELRRELSNATYVQDLIVNQVEALTEAYRKVASDLNVTSMCVYSGPVRSLDTSRYWLVIHNYGVHLCDDFSRAGWLGTGDAALKEKTRLCPFLLHYGRLLDEVATLTMPHHGSDANFHPDLLDRVTPVLCIAAAAKFSNWRHPGTNVVQSVASRGILFLVATDDERSVINESLCIWCK